MNNEIIIYKTTDGKAEIALTEFNGSVWLTQLAISKLFATSTPNVNMHIKNILKDKELDINSVIKDFLITATDGKEYKTKVYSLEMILAVGFRVRSKRAVEFRQWANRNLTQYLQKGFILNKERLNDPQGKDYFDELLAQIRDIRASEKRFYQKLRDLFSLSSDYDPTDKATQMFFAETQNKLIFATTQKTACELIVSRANASLPNMGLTSWKGSIVRKRDIVIAKNYLTADELDNLNRLVNLFLDSAEIRVKQLKTFSMEYWKEFLVRLLEFNEQSILSHAGKISHAQMEKIVKKQYEEFDTERKIAEAKQADLYDLKELEDFEKQSK